MPDKDAGTPRVFLVRHGETEWTLSGKFTGRTDISLTKHGEEQVSSTGRKLVGRGKLIDPNNLAKVYVSPRTRARRTCELLFANESTSAETLHDSEKVEITQDIREWEYGLYEGLKTAEIRKLRQEHGLDKDRPWNIWVDGCEEGESAVEMTRRLDDLISRIRTIQAPYCEGGKAGTADVLVIAHGHSLRAFAKRWIEFDMGARLPLMLEPGAVGVLSYEHHNIKEPALLLGVNMGGV